MPDHMDGVQEHALTVNDKNLALEVERIERLKIGGLGACIECGEPISDLRKSLGARHCMACINDPEVRT